MNDGTTELKTFITTRAQAVQVLVTAKLDSLGDHGSPP
jgi:hypothetical protein